MKRNSYSSILTVIRVLLGVIFLISGIGKLISGSDAQYLVELMATEIYWLIEYSSLIIIFTSVAELLLAFFLLWGKLLKWALAGSLLMLLSFSTVLGHFYMKGMEIENCGCFGAFGFASGLEFTLIRNLIMIAFTTGGFLLLYLKHRS